MSTTSQWSVSNAELLTHHSDQHVEQQNRHKDHENDENRFGQVGVRDVVQLGVLKREHRESSRMKRRGEKEPNHGNQ